MFLRILKYSIVVVLLIAGLGVASVRVFAEDKPGDNGPMIRIAVARDIEQVLIKMNSAYEISNPLTREILQKGMRFPAVPVRKGSKGLKIGSYDFAFSKIRFYARRDVSVYINDKEYRYRGFVDVAVNAQGKLQIVNQLEIEDYIRGVLYHEVSNRWPMESLKAQAVAARSYAVHQMKMNVNKEFDVTNDIYSQVYGGRGGERYRTNLAVESTVGEILTYQGKVLPAYFHATCGGHTEDSRVLWPRQDLPPLHGVRCIYCRESPHYFWKQNFQLSALQKKLNNKGYKIGLVEDIEITNRNSTDRIESLMISDREGKQLAISGKDFREAVGPNLIRSNNYYIVMQGYYCDLFGKGWGHGVGMCQWGAQGMGSLGFNYDRILQFYYPGTVISKIRNLDPARAF